MRLDDQSGSKAKKIGIVFPMGEGAGSPLASSHIEKVENTLQSAHNSQIDIQRCSRDMVTFVICSENFWVILTILYKL